MPCPNHHRYHRPLTTATQVDTLEQALADTTCSIGFTRRTGAARRTHASLGHLLAEFPLALPLQPPRPAEEMPGGAGTGTRAGAAQEAAAASATGPTGTTALVFGREESGLTEAELRLCR